MPHILTEPTLYVLGAGTSVEADIPLLRDFLVKARHLMNSRDDLFWGESFKNVFEFVDGLARAEVSLSINTENLEHVFSLIEMRRQINPAEGNALYIDLSKVIFETIDKSWNIRRRGGQDQPNDLLYAFVQNLKKNQETRREKRQSTSKPFYSDGILSFNYDLVLDYALHFSTARFDYGFNPSAGDKLPLYKIHGSMNWAKCGNKECNHEQVLTPSLEIPGHMRMIEEDELFSSNFATDLLQKIKCQKCSRVNTLFPIFIPPTWSKTLGENRVRATWENLVANIKNYSQIVVIGYSFPDTDTFFQYLLSLGLMAKNNLMRVVVVNPDMEVLAERCRRIFNGLNQKNKLVLIRGTFRDFVNKSGLSKVLYLETDAFKSEIDLKCI